MNSTANAKFVASILGNGATVNGSTVTTPEGIKIEAHGKLLVVFHNGNGWGGNWLAAVEHPEHGYTFSRLEVENWLAGVWKLVFG